ncbi:MAG: MFS transporter [Intrasporangium sp.]|uniref:MFS transporter n=1 Tax=Intrasporangium sp. TaxID=1925024 RepID=UPI002647126A|nr:MFS transporter [Intrasporangium sp.]MDN5796539.1 MFS transporter [Intrasporangium sp.]
MGLDEPPTPATDPADERWRLSPGILSVGGASMFSDTGHEMVTSLLPTFVTSTLYAGPATLGVIDGVADALTGLSKLAGGPLAAEPSRRGRLAGGGYLGTAVATAAIGLATAVWQVAVLRGLAWVSRGLRSPARDLLLTDLAPTTTYGRAFGVERAGDNLGAVLGPLLAAGLIGIIGIRHAILLSIIPSVLAAAAITVAARQARRTLGPAQHRRTLRLNLTALRRAGIVRLLTPVACFEMGNLATTLLILRATDILRHSAGWTVSGATSAAILMYAAHNVAASGSALLGGSLIDRLGPRPAFAAGALAYVVAYLLFASTGTAHGAIAGFLLAGIGIGLAETAESATVALGLPADLRPNAFGVLGLTQSVGDLGATLVAGVLWTLVSPCSRSAMPRPGWSLP